MKLLKIEIAFPIPVEVNNLVLKLIDSIISTGVCQEYNKANPDRVIWVAGYGDKPIWREPEEPSFDASCFQFDIAEKEKNK